MNVPDCMAELIPFYLNGTLDVPSRRKLEAHLPGCDTCGRLLAYGQALKEGSLAAGGDHIQAQLLVEFQEDPGSLEAEVATRVRTHLDACEPCRQALTILEDLSSLQPVETVQAASPPTERLQSFWERLAGSMLRPVPAFVTAVLVLVLLYPIYRSLQGGPDRSTPTAVIAQVGRSLEARAGAIVLQGEIMFRQSPTGIPQPAPQQLTVTGGDPILLVELDTDIDPEDLQDPAASFSLELLQEENVLFRQLQDATDFDERGRLRLLLDTARLDPEGSYTLVIRLQKTGDPLDGEILFRRGLAIQLD